MRIQNNPFVSLPVYYWLLNKQLNKNSPNLLWLGEIGTLDVGCHYNPLEVNSSYTGSIYIEKNKTIKFTFTLLKHDTYIYKTISPSEWYRNHQSILAHTGLMKLLRSQRLAFSPSILFISHLNNPYKIKKVLVFFNSC